MSVTTSTKKKEQISKKETPRHVAIIPDGNRRWANEQGLHPFEGHAKGAEVLTDTLRAAKDLGIETITFYFFSTENWARSKEEISALMAILVLMLDREREDMVEEGVCFDTIGDLSPFPDTVIEAIEKSKEATKDCDKINAVLALNYGSRNEITRAVQKIVDEGHAQVSEELIAKHLDTAPFGDPELLIRTSGELRVSNFLLWQLSYTEFVPMKIYWPDFTKEHLKEAVASYQMRKRRIGR